MANIVFQGPAALTLDSKGRLAMPARHRVLLEAMRVTQLTVTKHPDGCLMIFPRPIWETFRDHVASLPMAAVRWKRVFLGSAMDVDLDASGRLLIAPELRKATGLERDVMLLGMGNHLELWYLKKHEDHEAQVMASDMPESLKGFSF